jgi:hypothetical protein
MVLPLLKQLAIAAVGAAVDKLVKLISSKADDETPVDVESSPLPYKAIEHQRAQERASIAASKAARR